MLQEFVRHPLRMNLLSRGFQLISKNLAGRFNPVRRGQNWLKFSRYPCVGVIQRVREFSGFSARCARVGAADADSRQASRIRLSSRMSGKLAEKDATPRA